MALTPTLTDSRSHLLLIWKSLHLHVHVHLHVHPLQCSRWRQRQRPCHSESDCLQHPSVIVPWGHAHEAQRPICRRLTQLGAKTHRAPGPAPAPAYPGPGPGPDSASRSALLSIQAQSLLSPLLLTAPRPVYLLSYTHGYGDPHVLLHSRGGDPSSQLEPTHPHRSL